MVFYYKARTPEACDTADAEWRRLVTVYGRPKINVYGYRQLAPQLSPGELSAAVTEKRALYIKPCHGGAFGDDFVNVELASSEDVPSEVECVAVFPHPCMFTREDIDRLDGNGWGSLADVPWLLPTWIDVHKKA